MFISNHIAEAKIAPKPFLNPILDPQPNAVDIEISIVPNGPAKPRRSLIEARRRRHTRRANR